MDWILGRGEICDIKLKIIVKDSPIVFPQYGGREQMNVINEEITAFCWVM